MCFVQEWEQKSLRAECPKHEPCAMQRAALSASPAEVALLCKIKYSLGQRIETHSPVSEEKDQCTTLQSVPLTQSGLLYPLKTLQAPCSPSLGALTLDKGNSFT